MILVKGVATLVILGTSLCFAAGVGVLIDSWRRRNDDEWIIHVPCRMCRPEGTGWRDGEVCPLCDGESSLLLSEPQEGR